MDFFREHPKTYIFGISAIVIILIAAVFVVLSLAQRITAPVDAEDEGASPIIQELVVFPEEISGENNWTRVETLFGQEVDDQATFQAFNTENSAYIHWGLEGVAIASTGTPTTTPLVTPATSTATSSLPIVEEIVELPATSTNETEIATSTNDVGPVSKPESTVTHATTSLEQVEPETASTTATEQATSTIEISEPEPATSSTTTTTSSSTSSVLPPATNTATSTESNVVEESVVATTTPLHETSSSSTDTNNGVVSFIGTTAKDMWRFVRNAFSRYATAQEATTTNEESTDTGTTDLPNPEITNDAPDVIPAESTTTIPTSISTSSLLETNNDLAATAILAATNTVAESDVATTAPNDAPSADNFGSSTASMMATTTTSTSSTTAPEAVLSGIPENDTTPPELRVLGNNPAYIDIDSPYADLGAIIETEDDKNLGILTYVNGVETRLIEIDTATSGVHEIIYSVTDIAGNTGTASRIVVVGEAEIPSSLLAPEETIFEVAATTFCESEIWCEENILEFGSFGVTSLYDDETIVNAQLRVSLAAQVDAVSETIQSQSGNVTLQEGLIVEYFYQGTWVAGGSLPLSGEVSNALNNGHFLFALPVMQSLDELSELRVRLTHQGPQDTKREIYIDALWIDVETSHIPQIEEEVPEIYKRVLLDPSMNDLTIPLEDFLGGEALQFHFKYKLQRNPVVEFVRGVFTDQLFTIEGVNFIHPIRGPIDIPYEIIYGEDNAWSLHITGIPQKMPPGKYRIELDIREGGESFVDQLEFYWGVLAINTNKSRYVMGEEAYLQMASVDDRGDTVCDAILELEIESPYGTVTSVPVSQSGSCGPNNVTDIPDYQAYYPVDEPGTYIMRLKRLNTLGEIIHDISDTFEVAIDEVLPFDIERIGPTRIYPLAPYTMTLRVTPQEDYQGYLNERLPKGFVLSGINGAGEGVFADHKTLTWPVALKAGETTDFTYQFDAPDISPYLYLLGPADIGGTKESRMWQIASDAVSNIAWLTGFETTQGTTSMNTALGNILWATSSIDTLYFSHSTATNPERLTVKQAGDYLVSLTLPLARDDGTNNERSRSELDIRVDGVKQDVGVGRSSYIRERGGGNQHTESSSHLNVLLEDLTANQYITIGVQGATSDTDYPATTSQASFYAEYIGDGETVFTATSTRPMASTELNNAATTSLVWHTKREDSGFTHTSSSTDIQIDAAGNYLVFVNVPMSTTDARQNLRGVLTLDGYALPGTSFAQGYIRDSDGDTTSSIHYSGVITSTTTNQILNVGLIQEANAGSVTTGGENATIYIQQLPATDIFAARGTTVVGGGTNWNTTGTTSIEWTTQDIIDGSVYTHSDTVNPHEITVDTAGNYLLIYNDSLFSASARRNARISVEVNDDKVIGAETKSHYTRVSDGHSDTSGALTFLLENLSANDIITISTEAESDTSGTMVAFDDATVMLWRKATFDAPPDPPTLHDILFDNEKTGSSTPYFEFTGSDPDGSSDIRYQISWSTSTNFIASTTKTSGTDSGFENRDTPADTDPFTEAERIRFTVQSGDTLENETTYYWRVRAQDTSGSGNYGEWTTTQSFTVSLGTTPSEWFQTEDGQFSTDTFSDVEVSGNDSVQISTAVNTEAMMVYAEGTVQTPRYQIWNGSSWGGENSAVDVGGTIYWVVTQAAPTRDEYVLGTQDTNGDFNFQIYEASTTVWGDLTETGTEANNNLRRGFDVAYETTSGDAIAVNCEGVDAAYAVWDGDTWSATTSINLASVNNCEWIRLASDPTSDEIIMVTRDTGTQFEAQVWDGSAWGESITMGSMHEPENEGMIVEYEESGDQAIVVVSNNTAGSFIWNNWNGTSWGSNTTETAPQDDLEWATLARDDGTDNLAYCYMDQDNDIGYMTWNGTNWTDWTELEQTGNARDGRAVDCQFETSLGTDGDVLVVYSTTVLGESNTYTPGATSWSATSTVTTMTDSWVVQARRTGDGNILSLFFDDINDRLDFTYWNGSTWSSRQTIEVTIPVVGSVPIPESAMIAPKIFTAGTGYVESSMIDHDVVPNQNTWGDITFSTTEPGGSDVTLQVYYTNSATCDTIIPDGDLSGNGAGFDVTSSPIDISGLSTTTYNEICLRANLTQSGASSPELLDWNVSWVRQPTFNQNYFRWYANVVSFTPTDPWPSGGGTDLTENTVIGTADAVSPNDILRLRMSLQVSNVTLATSTQAFKLQYAEGSSCSGSLDWIDVGAPAGSEIWRGYENSITVSDWYNTSWPYRIAVTVQSSQVTDNLTDYPVYVDLADLGSSFFTNLNSDGGDIRVTEGNGTTEIAREVVFASTTLETGELYFLASTTSTTIDHTFYIYHGNSGASDYATTSTYGAQNVWTNGFEAVFHLQEDPGGTAPQMIDSTGNTHDATTLSMTSSNSVAGKAGNSLDHDGAGADRARGTGFANLGNSDQAYSIGAWFNADTGETDGNIIHVSANDDGTGWCLPMLALNGSNIQGISWAPGQSTARGTTTITQGIWNQGYTTWDGTNGLAAYLNGAEDDTNAQPNFSASGVSNYIHTGFDPGGCAGNEAGFDGQIDEVRIYDERKDSGWISTEYRNIATTTDFYTVSSQEALNDGHILPSVVLSVSDQPQTYEEVNNSALNPNNIIADDDGEWDWVIQNNGATSSTQYCFRMVTDDGTSFTTYTNYPQLVTDGPPNTPIHDEPFDNEQFADQTPSLEFAADDGQDDDITYQVQVSQDYLFGTTVISANSEDNGTLFTNLSTPSDKNPFTSGQTIQFTGTTTLSDNTTYWWRVRGRDPNGSNEWSSWSSPWSFTIDTTTTITTWYQTTQEQFDTDTLESATTTASDDIVIEGAATNATATSPLIDFDWRDTGNTWGTFDFNDVEASGDILYHIEYFATTSTWELIPDTDLSGNAAGFDAGPVNLITLDTDTYNQIRLRADFTDGAGVEQILDWTVEWGLGVEKPTLLTLFDNEKANTTTPLFTFLTTDPQSDDLIYEYSYSASTTFLASTTRNSLDHPTGFSNLTTPADTSPFNSGDTIQYEIQPGDALTSSSTYWWRVRARDPSGGNTWSTWSNMRSLTVDESINVSTWFQTTDEQFDTDTYTDTESDPDTYSVRLTTTIQEVLVAYAESTVQSPRYRFWNGTHWGDEQSALSVGSQIFWVRAEGAPTRNEYALGTQSTDGDVNVQILDNASSTWSDLNEITTEITQNNRRAFDIAYETLSGDLLVATCNGGSDFDYAIWDGTSWTATTTVALASVNDCQWLELASDPTSDEIIVVARDTGTSYEAQVWNGAGWGNSTTGGSIGEGENEGIAVSYEESGDQAVIAVSNGGATNFLWNAWNGTSWSGFTTQGIGDDFEHGKLVRDVGTDNMALCYIDHDTDMGIVRWTGAGWQTNQEFEQQGNSRDGRSISCEFETTTARDGYIMVPHTNNQTGAYTFWDGIGPSMAATSSIATTTDSWRVVSTRSGDGIIFAAFIDDIIDDYYVSHWDGTSWTDQFTLNDAISDTGTPISESLAFAPRIYPEFNSGSIQSTDINFSDGTGPKWGQFYWNDTTPGASTILYQIFYESATSTYTLIPDGDLPDNSTGTSTTVNLGDLDFQTYDVLRVQANFNCDSGDCPTMEDWTVEWSEGIVVSGTANQYDRSASTTSGTVAVAVNGTLQSGKTGTIDANGDWSIQNVTVFADDIVTVFIDGAADLNEAVGITKYDGIGDITGFELYERHLSLGTNDNSTTTNTDIGQYDNSVSSDEDIFHDVTGGNLDTCAEGGCSDVNIYIKENNEFRPDSGGSGNVTTHDVVIDGWLSLDSNTITVNGSWDNNWYFDAGTGAVVLSATSTTESLDSTNATSSAFYDLTFGTGSGNATWTPITTLDIDNDATITYGVYSPGPTSTTIAGGLTINANGTFAWGGATTTFDGSGTDTWTDNTTPKQNLGIVIIDGSTKTIQFGSNVAANDITIEADDILSASGSHYDIEVFGEWTNNNVFTANQGTVTFSGTTTGLVINTGGSAFYDLTFNGVDGAWSFIDTTIDVNNNFTAATGTVTLPVGTTTVGGSFDASTGTFAHNNSVVNFDSTSAETIALDTDPFLNNFYQLTFDGSGGAWSFVDAVATATQDVLIKNGTVTFPTDTIAIGGSLEATSGSFNNNAGTVYFNAAAAQHLIDTNGANFYDVMFDDGGMAGAAWYNTSWPYRIAVTVQSSQVTDNLTDYPVYVDLADLGSSFFTNLNSDGGDIRVTEGNGTTEIAREVVFASTTLETGELYFLASTTSTTIDHTFYIYYGNSGASDYATTSTYGAQNVWTNGFEAVFHLQEDPGGTAPQMIDSTGNTHDATTDNMDSTNQVSGEAGYGLDANGTDESLIAPGFSGLGTNNTPYSMGIWFNADTGETDGNIIGMSASDPPGGWRIPPITLNGGFAQAISWSGSQSTALGSTSVSTGVWHQAYTSWDSAPGLAIYLDGAEDDTNAQATYIASGVSNYLHFAGDIAGGAGDEGHFNGQLDEIRIYDYRVPHGWVSTEYRNIASSTDFYATSSVEAYVTWTFTETTADVDHDFEVVSGDITLPATTFSVGGSFINSALGTITHQNNTILFNGTSTGNTIEPAAFTFYDMTVNGSTGGWLVTQDATTTNNLTLTDADTFGVGSGISFEVNGTFANSLTSASTTWSESTLYLNSGSNYTINTKGVGDDYGNFLVGSTTDIRMWDSQATGTVTTEMGGSLYSQDNAGSDGDLYIYGDYRRTSGTDYWSYATDFDGTSLSGGSERVVVVSHADQATSTFHGGTIQIIGTSLATTTITNQSSGTYDMVVADGSTINAQYYAFRNLAQNGLTITGEPTVTSLDNGGFELAVDTGTLITVGSSTIDANSELQINNVIFATSTLIGGFNVTATGTPTSYWWFRDHEGNLAGENFDVDPGGNPGNVRWDDSGFTISVSGTVYSDDGITAMGGLTCDGATNVVRVRVNGGGDHIAPCDGGDGTFTVSGVQFSGDPVLTIFLDNALGGERAVTVTQTPTGDLTGIDLYQNQLIARHENIDVLTIADIAEYDSTDDSDVFFTAATGSPDTLDLEPNTGLYVWSGKTFQPGGNMTLESGGSGDAQDGSVYVDNLGSLIASTTETHSIGGSWILDLYASFNSASTTLTFTATTTSKTIANGTSTFNELIFNGTGGEWSIGSSTTVHGDIAMTAGTLIGPESVTVRDGDVSGAGTITMSGGTFTIENTGNLGGATNWTFNSLSLGDGTANSTTTKFESGDIEVAGVLTIANNHVLQASTTTWILSGGGTPFVETGTFAEQSSLVRYTGTSATNILATDYERLELAASGGSPTYTVQAGTFTVNDSLTVGDGTNAVTATFDTNDPTISVGGTTTINQNGTLVGSSANTLTLGASWVNDGAFTHANGTIEFNASTTGHTIQASTSPFFNVNIASSSGGWTITEHATATNNFNLNVANDFTVDANVSLAVGNQFSNGIGGAATTWTNSTLHLYGGNNYTVNTKSISDTYGTLVVTGNTDTRFWNSSAATTFAATDSSIYSQDHANSDGDLYIWGDYIRSSGTDYWNHDFDFDGVALSGGSARQADVYLSDNATTTLMGGALEILGTTTASTTIQAQGSGTYALYVTGGTLNAEYYSVRDINSTGLEITGTPTITELGNGDFLLEIDGGSMITVGSTAIDNNPSKTFSSNGFATSSGISSGFNVTATGTAVQAWRFTGYFGNYGGEDNDSDPGGDPGYIIWDDSDNQISISGNVYEADRTTVSSACGAGTVVRMLVQGGSSQSASCNGGTGAYSFSGITFTSGDTITVYLDTAGVERAVTVTVDPVTNITNMDLYEEYVIVRHEDTNALTIDNMEVYDTSDDADIPYDAVNGSPDTLTVDPNVALLIWENKEFAPGGNVTLESGGSGDTQDGTLYAKEDATLTLATNETHSIGGSFVFGANTTFTGASSTITFTATTTGKTIHATSSPFQILNFNGSGGAWSFPPGSVVVTDNVGISAGTVTLGSGTSTVGGSFVNSAGTFAHNNGTLYLTSTAAGEILQVSGSDLYNLSLNGTGGDWTIADTNATTSHDVIITAGSIKLPGGLFSVGGSFDNDGGSFDSNIATTTFTGTTAETVYANGSDFGGLVFDGSGGTFTMIDQYATATEGFVIEVGTVNLATGTLAVGDSFVNNGGSFVSGATTTVRLYGSNTGNQITPNGSLFTNLIIDSASGGWTLVGDATTTGDFHILDAGSYNSAGFIEVQDEFINYEGTAQTIWGGTLYLNGTATTTINQKNTGDDYHDLIVGSTTHIVMWDSQATTSTTVEEGGSIYSQDHAASDGNLYIFGDYQHATGTDYWSYATDFDGTDLSGGSERLVSVLFADNATATYSGGTLNMVGASTASSTVNNQGSGNYSLRLFNATLNAQYYTFRNLDGTGLDLSMGTNTTITSLSNGDFELSVDGGNMISAASTTIDNNPTLIITGTRFATSSGIASGFNLSRDGAASNSWTLTSHYGNYDGESFDNDGGDACGNFKWDDSTCLEVTQEHYRWRNDDGGEGALDSEWYNASWDKRKRILIEDTHGTTQNDVQVKLVVQYDSDMQTDFDDLRFTDSSGTTSIPHFTESHVTSASSTVWVRVPTLTANATTTIYMYYDNAIATDGSDGDTTFLAFDSFEDNDISEYSGDTSLFETSTSFNYQGTYGVDASSGNETAQTTDGIYQTGGTSTINQGETIRFFQYIDMTSGSDDEPCALFGIQTPGSNNNNYAVCLDPFNTDQIVVAENVSSNDGSGTTIASTDVTFTTGWYEVEIDWLTDDSIDVEVFRDGSSFATVSTSDTSYSSGGFGFSFWAQNGGWDYFASRIYLSSDPVVTFDPEQEDGGATWRADEDTAISGLEASEDVRLRFTVSNTGAQLTDQNFNLQVAPKGGAAQCESVVGTDYTDVPNAGSCDSNDVACMVASSNVTNLGSTTPLLSHIDSSLYTYGQQVESPSTQTGDIDVAQREYTEVEFAFELTANATSSAYCFRAAESSTALDSYSRVAEVVLRQVPVLGTWVLNAASDIILTPGTTTTVSATGTVSDANGFADLVQATSTHYRSGGGAGCSADEQSCYEIASTSCSFSACAGTSCTLTCSADIWFFADPTDIGVYSAQDWLSRVSVSDASFATTTATSLGVEMMTLRALDVTGGPIDYGSLSVNTDTGSTNATTTIFNEGNDAIDVDVSGSNMTSGPSSIGVTNQSYATSTFNYSLCTVCSSLTGTDVTYEIDLPKPTTTSSTTTDQVFWGLFVPTGVSGTAHEGTNTFTAVGD